MSLTRSLIGTLTAGMWRRSTPFDRINIIGNDLRALRRQTLAQCMKECDNQQECKAITYALQHDPTHTPDCDPNDNCWLKTAASPTAVSWEPHDKLDMVTFFKPPAPKSCTDDALCKTALGTGISGAIGLLFSLINLLLTRKLQKDVAAVGTGSASGRNGGCCGSGGVAKGSTGGPPGGVVIGGNERGVAGVVNDSGMDALPRAARDSREKEGKLGV